MSWAAPAAMVSFVSLPPGAEGVVTRATLGRTPFQVIVWATWMTVVTVARIAPFHWCSKLPQPRASGLAVL